jgi:ankyrin repeat protein
MPTLVTYKHVLEYISQGKFSELPCLLRDLKNFPPQEWHDCIRRVQSLPTPRPENDKSVRLLLNWGAENNWFQLLEQATAYVGEDTRFETDGWMKMIDEGNREVSNSDKNMLSVSQHKYSSKYPNKELWWENSGYNVAAALFEEHPELSVKVVSGTKRSIYHLAAQKNASAILILAADVAQEKRLDNHNAINSRDGAKRTPLAWAVLYNNPGVVRTLFQIFPDLNVTESDVLQAINYQQKDIVTCLSEHRPYLININMVRRAMKVSDVKTPDFNIWKTLVRVLIKSRPQADQKQSDEQFMELTDLLHFAVQERRLEMVQDLVEQFPTLTVQRDHYPNSGHTVLWYNTSKNDEPRTAIQDKIRQLIVPVVIGLKSSVEDIRTFIRDDGKESFYIENI